MPLALALASLSLCSLPALVQDADAQALFADLDWREIGPANMGGRITDLAVHPREGHIWYVGSATGGLFKTTDAGASFAPVLDSVGSSSIGAIGLSLSDPEQVWIGTGEANPRNSVSWGDGVYRSLDGGESWEHMGLSASKHIGAVEVHPSDPNTVFVAAMGSTWGENEERGLYRTSDGGASWQAVLQPGPRIGCIDVRIDPSAPDFVYAATWERWRDEFDSNDPAQRTGAGSGLWRSSDGGTSWERLGNGLPTVDIGRIGLDLFHADPQTLFAIIETERSGERGAPERSSERVALGLRGSDAEGGGFLVESVTAGESAAQAGVEAGDIITAVDETIVTGRSQLVATLRTYAPGDGARLIYVRGGQELVGELAFLGRMQGRGRSFAGSQGGQVANEQDAQGPDGFETGGVFRSDDRGQSWRRLNSLNPRPFYYSQVRVNPWNAEHLWVLGIQLHFSSDGGESFGTLGRDVHADHHSMWIDPADPEHVVLGNDGGVYVSWDEGARWSHEEQLSIAQFYNIAVDLKTPYNVYGGLQDNGTWGGPSSRRSGEITTADWITINGGDGFRCAVDPSDPDIVYSESQNGALMRLNVKTSERFRIQRPEGVDGLRFNWNTPFLLSPHDPAVLLWAGNRVLRSDARGEDPRAISEEITRTERGSATALAQSHHDPNVMWVGTDDGALARTLDGGESWESIVDALPGVTEPLYISDLEPSPLIAGRVYVTLDGHRSDDYGAHVFVSDDDGASWTRITNGLPEASVRNLACDPHNPALLFLGNEFSCYASLDAGATWREFANGLPTVPVHDLVVHPREGELVAGTHGRGVWIADVTPLQRLTPEVLAGGPALLSPQAARLWNSRPTATQTGTQGFRGAPAPRGALLSYWLPEDAVDDVRLRIYDADGERVAVLEGQESAGLQTLRWDLRPRTQRGGGGQRRGGFGGGFGGGGTRVEAGSYRVELTIGEAEPLEVELLVLPDPEDEAGSSL